ncbi:pentapeptide repeat-containing protein, partial [Mycobacterium bourgelatii]
FNTGDLNTGIGNTGNINTGAFNQGNLNNGFFWRADGQGQTSTEYSLTIGRIGVGLEVDIPINIPVTGALGNIVVPSFTIPRFYIRGDEMSGSIGPIVVDQITVTGPSLNLLVGGPGESLHLSLSGPGLGPIVVPLQLLGGAGFG